MGKIDSLIAVVERLTQRVYDLEVKVDNIRVQLDNHNHTPKYIPPPVYGGR